MTEAETNEEKKKYLNGYCYSKKRECRLEQQIADLREQKMNPSIQIDGMPKGNGCSDLSGYAARLDALIRQLEQEREMAVKEYEEIHTQIHKMQDETEREVLIRRYLLGETWEQIAVEMSYNYRWVLRIHGKALKNFEIPKRSH